MVMSSVRTRLVGKYMMLPDIGVGACGKNTATQSFSSFSSRYPICQPSSMLDQDRLQAARTLDMRKAFRHAFYQLVMRQATSSEFSDQRLMRPPNVVRATTPAAKARKTRTRTDKKVAALTPATSPH